MRIERDMFLVQFQKEIAMASAPERPKPISTTQDPCVLNSLTQQVHKLLEVLVRGPPMANTPASRVLEQQCPLLDLGIADHLLHLAPHLLLRHDPFRIG